jgi:hypothetical protein
VTKNVPRPIRIMFLLTKLVVGAEEATERSMVAARKNCRYFIYD